MSEDSLFHAEMINEDGVSGTSFVKGGLSVKVNNVSSPEEGTNPEELLGLSWATCLNATIQSLLKGRGISAKSKVEVHVDLKKEETIPGIYFDLKAFGSIEGLPLQKTNQILTSAHRRCPVSKIIDDYEHVTIQAVPFS